MFAQGLQPVIDEAIVNPLTRFVERVTDPSSLTAALLVGDYGLLTLGWYSFLWAFPVVLLIGVAVAITEETGLKDRITASLDPLLRAIGLSGRDMVPVLTGFGCNVVAVFQSRACSACNRKNCVSMIAFASACSYQIGASLSIFNTGRRPMALRTLFGHIIYSWRDSYQSLAHRRFGTRANVTDGTRLFANTDFPSDLVAGSCDS